MTLILTTKGLIDDSFLDKTEGESENDSEIIKWQEWRLDGELIKREVQMHLKQGIALFSQASL